MALYGIDYKCGHDAEVQIYGTNAHGERDRKVAWYESQDCPACRARKARGGEDGMAALEGSDKQVAWAGDIRDKVMASMRQARSDWAAKGAGDKELDRADSIIGWLCGQTSASWWIDHDTAGLASRACQVALAGKEA